MIRLHASIIRQAVLDPIWLCTSTERIIQEKRKAFRTLAAISYDFSALRKALLYDNIKSIFYFLPC